MSIRIIENRSETMIDRLFHIWKRSVRATHIFLSEEEIQKIAVWVPAALRGVEHLVIAADEEGEPAAFMGIDGRRLEMLFLAPEERGKGLGRQLLSYGIRHYSVNELCVNEQNPGAAAFYEHMGFQVYKRTELDEQGNPYPLLYMKLPE